MAVEKLSLVDDVGQTSEAVSPVSAGGGRWRFHSEAGAARVYENLRAMPRAWLARETISLSPEEILRAIKTSRLPDGREFDPARTALVEEASGFTRQEPDAQSGAEVVYLSDTVIEVRTSSTVPAFLVTSDPYYPGWQASIDGEPARLLRTDYAIRGVILPAGSHRVRFEFRPRTFCYGALIAALSFAALLVIFSKPIIRAARGGNPA
jgi:hypothetical protein